MREVRGCHLQQRASCLPQLVGLHAVEREGAALHALHSFLALHGWATSMAGHARKDEVDRGKEAGELEHVEAVPKPEAALEHRPAMGGALRWKAPGINAADRRPRFGCQISDRTGERRLKKCAIARIRRQCVGRAGPSPRARAPRGRGVGAPCKKSRHRFALFRNFWRG